MRSPAFALAALGGGLGTGFVVYIGRGFFRASRTGAAVIVAHGEQTCGLFWYAKSALSGLQIFWVYLGVHVMMAEPVVVLLHRLSGLVAYPSRAVLLSEAGSAGLWPGFLVPYPAVLS